MASDSIWEARASYLFLEMHIKRAPNSLDIGSAPGIEGSSPRHQLLTQSGFDLPKGVSVDLLYRYVSALPGQAFVHIPVPNRRSGTPTIASISEGMRARKVSAMR